MLYLWRRWINSTHHTSVYRIIYSFLQYLTFPNFRENSNNRILLPIRHRVHYIYEVPWQDQIFLVSSQWFTILYLLNPQSKLFNLFLYFNCFGKLNRIYPSLMRIFRLSFWYLHWNDLVELIQESYQHYHER